MMYKGKAVEVSDLPLTIDLLAKYGHDNLDKIIEELKIWGITWKYC
jgi:hypothetical protein